MPVIPNESGTHWCSICGAPYTEWGHSAYPVNTGRCCNECNDLTVIPARIRAMRKAQEKEKMERFGQHDAFKDPNFNQFEFDERQAQPKDSAAKLVSPSVADEAPVPVDATEPGPAQTSWANPHDKKGQSE